MALRRCIQLRQSLFLYSFPRLCVVSTQNQKKQQSQLAWEKIIEGIEEVTSTVTNNNNNNISSSSYYLNNNLQPWRRLCELWRNYFPNVTSDVLQSVLEEEFIAGVIEDSKTNVTNKNMNDSIPYNDNNKLERIPRDLNSLPIFVQALCAAVQLGEAQLQFIHSSQINTLEKKEKTNSLNLESDDDIHNNNNIIIINKDIELISSVIAELRVVAFYLAKERMIHALYASFNSSQNRDENNNNNNNSSSKEIILEQTLIFPSREKERVCNLGVRLSQEELEEVIIFANTGVSLLALNPPISLLPILYRLLLPALSACEQLESHYLASLATAIAQSADFETFNNNDVFSENNNNNNNEKLRPIITSYTVLSHLHAIARAMEVQMREVLESLEAKSITKSSLSLSLCTSNILKQTSSNEARMRLLSLKERKSLERQSERKPRTTVTDNNNNNNNKIDSFKLLKFLQDIAVVSSALSARRYSDDRFWNSLTVCTVKIIETIPTLELLQDVRDVLFALDYVQQRVHFNSIMSVLVKLGLLKEAISPPSIAREAMREVKAQQTAVDFQEQEEN